EVHGGRLVEVPVVHVADRLDRAAVCQVEDRRADQGVVARLVRVAVRLTVGVERHGGRGAPVGHAGVDRPGVGRLDDDARAAAGDDRVHGLRGDGQGGRQAAQARPEVVARSGAVGDSAIARGHYLEIHLTIQFYVEEALRGDVRRYLDTE